MRAPVLRLHHDELIVDSFAGGGGASLGIEMALGRSPDIAINHDPEALRMHRVNHPSSLHYCEDVWAVDPVKAVGGSRVGLMWLSPDCKHFSKAKGGRPVEKKIRGLAWVAVKWAKAVSPRVIVLENVEEFQHWGPLLEDGRPCSLRKGLTFRRFVRQLERCGYDVAVQALVAADYGAPTTRKRLFLIARCDGNAIAWPAPTHGKHRAHAWRTAAECIEWSLPCPSIFERIRPLAENTLRRIARGIRKYVIEAAQPFIVPIAHYNGRDTVHPIDEPLRTIAAETKGGEFSLVTPFVSPYYGIKGNETRAGDLHDPLPTQCGDPRFGLVSPTLIQTGYGERPGQQPRVPGLEKPLGTVVDGQKHALVSAFLAKHYGDRGQRPGSGMREPVSTITACDHNALVAANLMTNTTGHSGRQMEVPIPTVTSGNHHAVVASHLTKFKGTSQHGQQLDLPLHTIQAGGGRGGIHYGEVRAFLSRYNGCSIGNSLDVPVSTLDTTDRLGLVTVNGEEYAIADIGMRMLQPRELFRAQGFPDTYRIETDAEGKPFTKSAQVRCCGNSVCPPLAAAILRAQFEEQVSIVAA